MNPNSETTDKTAKALANIKPKARHYSLLKSIEKIIESHTQGSHEAESRVIYCSSSCLAKDIHKIV